ncbi:hypothetical protein N2152v2_007116 [Parachlorella kessleri]
MQQPQAGAGDRVRTGNPALPRYSALRTRIVTAVAAPEAPSSTDTFQQQYRLPNNTSVKVEVQNPTGDEQLITVSTDRQGRILLHWGVEGGENYKGGWRLPGDSVRPADTANYKNRALQTPFVTENGDGQQVVRIHLAGGEASDYLNFVLKDETTRNWYDLNGSNFHIPLRPELQQQRQPGSDDQGESDSENTVAPLLPLDRIPQLPQELCGIWAYIKWEAAGCPHRSKEEADREYETAIKELTTLLRRSVPMEELWRVARGEIKYQNYMKQAGHLLREAGAAGAAKQASILPSLPQELINIQAYILWEQAGKPDGADFGGAAKRALEGRLRAGASVSDLEKELKAPAPAPAPAAAPHQQQAAAPAPAKARPPAQPVVGKSLGMRSRNPLDLIHRVSDAPLMKDAKPAKDTPLTPLLRAARSNENTVWDRLYSVGEDSELLVTVEQADRRNKDSPVTVRITSTLPEPPVLHWGVRRAGRNDDWVKPSDGILPYGSTVEGIAADSPFSSCKDKDIDGYKGSWDQPLSRVTLQLPNGHGLTSLIFVLKNEDGSSWWKDGSGNFTVPLPGAKREKKGKGAAAGFDDDLSRTIVDCEVNTGAWTLMHRCNKAADLLGDVLAERFENVEDALVRIYVWMRYSAIRQLTWQRNYNTQPRILGSAQDRLTHKIAEVYARTSGDAQEWARNLLTTVGRGGNAQAVRDEILNVMHRNKLPEKKGTWMEEWHQKLHNNTTPDDVPICEAYLAFLEGNGDRGAYWRVLSEAGISRQRLESFDRPIVTEPEFFPDKKDALIRDLNNYLNILKSTHSGADLQFSASAAARFVPDTAKGYLGYVLSHSNDPQILPLIEAAVEARTDLNPILRNNRELLYLDLALENVVRAAAERGAVQSGAAAAAFVAPLLQNLALSAGDNEEICYCLKAWNDLPDYVRRGQRPNKDDAMKAMSVIDRIHRALAEVSEHVFNNVDPVARSFGEAFGADSWAVNLFAEEVIRGGPAFAVSLVLRSVEPEIRKAAELGAWQIISPANTVGRVVVVPNLHGIQDKVYEEPTVLLAKRVTGEEEVPVGAVGLLSGDAPDVLSHLSVRARNMKVLFAACHDAAALEEVERLAGKYVSFETTAQGDVNFEEVDPSQVASHKNSENGAGSRPANLKMKIPRQAAGHRWCGKWVVSMDEYAHDVVGAKSRNLAALRGKLPDWISLPASVTVPLGAFEEVLKQGANRDLQRQLEEVVRGVTPANAHEKLKVARDLVMEVAVPKDLQDSLKWDMAAAGIPVPQASDRWKAAMSALKAVWASKYNERAYYSTRKVGINFEDVRMAVLTQRVVPAQYAFVIHTTNPSTGDSSEIYCELVKGLGEAIVSGTVPGASLGFVASKDDLDNPRVVMYPSKSEGMFVRESLIFRSDSNGEDLEGYAGAGLYESVTMDATERKKVDYGSDRIMQDMEFRRKLMSEICKAGMAIENTLGGAQDVEGVVGPDNVITIVQSRPQM